MEQIGRDARRAYDLDAEASPWRSVACVLMGMAAYLAGDEADARRRLREGGDRAGDALPSIYMLSRTCLGVIDLLAGDRAGARLHAARAQQQVEASGLQEYATVALLESLRALQAAHAAETDRARALSRHARMLMSHNADVTPWLGAIGRILLARAALLTGDEDAARALIHEAAELRLRLPDSSVLLTEIESTQRTIDGLPPGVARGSGTLTTAELRVLQYLPTHLTFREIGERVHLSRFTIKSQSLAVYRKLGANSRSEAVARARGLGLLADDWPAAGPEPGLPSDPGDRRRPDQSPATPRASGSGSRSNWVSRRIVVRVRSTPASSRRRTSSRSMAGGSDARTLSRRSLVPAVDQQASTSGIARTARTIASRLPSVSTRDEAREPEADRARG